jgi:hypothetical protein
MFDYFWQVMVGNTGSAITTSVLEWFGYEGDFKIQKQNFIRMLKNNAITFKELTRKDKEIELYPTIPNSKNENVTRIKKKYKFYGSYH